ncbi:hypothetical protein [Natronococcus occultus]|uniref:Copper binding protein, plastocyanin/azurin family n=1 Tax=Natronococcus occultus SP4 TaxID=694430 RepID=L0K0S1_9EURY|nr:hypothetical protein [Natronococcus occultus]AGB38155.1 hypothetical protein Natoc_2379 [Natronococcus occultus SP4]
MTRTEPRSRRSTLRLVGATAGVALAAGCTEGTGDGEGVPDQNESDETVSEEADEDDPDPPEDEWEDVSTLEFEADTDGWIGVEPEAIEDVENPDIVLYEGREYEFRVTNVDGDVHNFALWDGSDPVASTAFLEDDGASTTFEAEVTTEVEQYLCETHPEEMAGAVELREE